VKSRFLLLLTAITFFTAMATPLHLAAQDNQNHNQHHNYKLTDLGTFGGPQSWVFGGSEAPAATLNNAGTVIGGADTSASNPIYPNFNPFMGLGNVFGYADPFVNHAFKWNANVLTDLGVLPGGTNSFAQWINGNGTIIGASETGPIDPVTGWPEIHAVVWQDGQQTDLGTFGGYESTAFGVNNRDQVVGAATDATNNSRAFLWTRNQDLQDLGTLGASIALANLINEQGQIAGVSGLCDTCNQDAFFWESGKMQRIPDFGGTISFPNEINNRGQVVGQSNLAGDQAWHGFLWEKGVLTDLPTLGGCCSGAHWINESGTIVGYAYDTNQLNLAVLWKNGKVKNVIGTVDGDACGIAQSINSASQVVGFSDAACDGTVLHAFLWENSGPPVDLNTLIPPGSGLQLAQAVSINDRGEIAGQGATSAGDNHAFLLIPCDENHPGIEGCDYSPADVTTRQRTQPVTPQTGRTPPSTPPQRSSLFSATLLSRNGEDLLPDTLDGGAPRCIRGCTGTGYCTLDSHNKLTGTCFGSISGGSCASKSQPVQCPIGRPAISPTNFTCGIGVTRVDGARKCTD
jgi:probable HAF family extracellular repeat protein